MRTFSIPRYLIEVVHQGILKAYFKLTSSIRPFLYGFFSLSYFNKCRYFNMIQYASWFDIFQTKRSVYLVESKFYWQIPIERKEKNKLLLFQQSRGHKISRTHDRLQCYNMQIIVRNRAYRNLIKNFTLKKLMHVIRNTSRAVLILLGFFSEKTHSIQFIIICNNNVKVRYLLCVNYLFIFFIFTWCFT